MNCLKVVLTNLVTERINCFVKQLQQNIDIFAWQEKDLGAILGMKYKIVYFAWGSVQIDIMG